MANLDKMLDIASGLQGTNSSTSTRLPVSPVIPSTVLEATIQQKRFPEPLKLPLANVFNL